MTIFQEFGPEIWKELQLANVEARHSLRSGFARDHQQLEYENLLEIVFEIVGEDLQNLIAWSYSICKNMGGNDEFKILCMILDLSIFPLPLKEWYSICQWLIVCW